MKSFILAAIAAITLSTATFATPAASPEAVKAYQAKQYEKSAQLLLQEVEANKKQGKESAALYYNLGNAYFRANEVAKAILYYERAQLLDPSNADISHNIAYANTRIEDKIVKAGNFFVRDWYNALENLFTSNTWAALAIISFLALIASCFFFFFGKKIWIKKTAFYGGLASLALVLLFNLFAAGQKNDILNKNTAIVMAPTVQVKSSPDENGKDIFTLHAGTKVRISKSDSRWLEIEIDNGNVGWLPADKIEII